MLNRYDDIRSRITEEPTWHDSNGVPRYGKFHPSQSPNIYAGQVLLYEIACQTCDSRFLVEENWSKYDLVAIVRERPNPSLEERVKAKRIHYGDPPCWICGSGCTMNCIDKRTVQFWEKYTDKDHLLEWRRRPELEGLDLEQDWAQEEESI